jgi:hypothetical protein
MNSRISFIIKRLSNPRVRRRLKIGLTAYGGVLLLVLLFKFGYDIGYFNAQSAKDAKIAEQQAELQPALHPAKLPALTMESAQRIVSGALKEDLASPKTVVEQILDNNHKLSAIIIENNKIKKIAWIIDMRWFFSADLYSDKGVNLTEDYERQYNIRADF